MSRLPALPPQRLLTAARRAAAAAVEEVAAMAAAARRRLRPDAIRRKGVGDFVTAVDLRAEQALRRRLRAALPEAGFLGEETGAADTGRDLVWVVDPIDGTSNFAAGLPHWAVAVALVCCGLPVVAVVWCEPDGLLFEAVRGRGAWRAGRRLRVRRARWDDGSIVGVQWHRGAQDLEFVAQLTRDGARARTFGCTVSQLVDVALGRLDANVQQQGRLWDVVAPALLLEEAGGRFTDWSGQRVFPVADLDCGHLPSIGATRAVLPHVVRCLRGSARPEPPPS